MEKFYAFFFSFYLFLAKKGKCKSKGRKEKGSKLNLLCSSFVKLKKMEYKKFKKVKFL